MTDNSLSNLTFEEKKIQGYSRFGDDRAIPLLTRLVLKTGLAKDERQAEKILVSIAVALIVIAVFVMVRSYQPVTIKAINIKS